MEPVLTGPALSAERPIRPRRPEWARAAAVSDPTPGGVGHLMALEDPVALGTLVAHLPPR
jgi:hypothetical protein